MDEELIELEFEQGELLLEEMDPDDEIGDSEQFGWAGIYDTSWRDDFDVECVIVVIWPDSTMYVNGYTTSALAAFPWLLLSERFCLPDKSMLPRNGDMVIFQMDEECLIDARSGLMFQNFSVVEEFAKRADLVKRGKRVWFLDKTGNHFLMDL